MTGEVTIHGKVRGVGIVAKVNAAREAKARVIPKDNWQELFTGLSGIEVIPIRHVSEALRHAVVGSRAPVPHFQRSARRKYPFRHASLTPNRTKILNCVIMNSPEELGCRQMTKKTASTSSITASPWYWSFSHGYPLKWEGSVPSSGGTGLLGDRRIVCCSASGGGGRTYAR